MSKDRTDKATDPGREDRASSDRAATEDRRLTEDEFVENFRSQMTQTALPDIPVIPGYHVIWLTTTNPRDSILQRMRMGYELLRSSDFPGYESLSLKTGEYAGCIAVNEMIAAKLPLSLYERYMQEVHFDAPNREREKLVAGVDMIRSEARERGADILEGDGITELRKSVKRPNFSANEPGYQAKV